MDVTLPSLKATELTSVPTEEELLTLLREHKEFWGKVGGLLILTGKYGVAGDQQQRMNKLLGMTVQIQMVIDALQGISQIAVPQPHLVQRQ